MNFVIIFGPGAVGKMTVGMELQKQTGLRLFHNHMTIDLVTTFFDWGTPQFKLVAEFRRRIFEEVAASELPGLIFTYMWDFSHADDKRYIDECCAIFQKRGARICFVELEADFETRLGRNRTELRLREKPSKRNLDRSEALMRKHEQSYQLNSIGPFYYPENYLRINNTDLAPEKVAQMIVERFALPCISP